MTNDARPTRQRPQKTTYNTKRLQKQILDYLNQFVPPTNITFLESPPLRNNDIFPYNDSTYRLAKERKVGFAYTLVGEDHLWQDGIHVRNDCRYLLVKTLAAAILNLNPNKFFQLARPPHGPFGPWTAPIGQGMTPGFFPSFAGTASAPPYFFRRQQQQRWPVSRAQRTNIQGP